MGTLLTYDETAKFLGLKKSTLYSMVCRNAIPHTRWSGRSVRFDLEELERWLKDHKVEAKPVADKRR